MQDPSKGGKVSRWSKSGTVVEKLSHDEYMVSIHGSRAATKRNRWYLRKIFPLIPEEQLVPTTSPSAVSVSPDTVTELAERFVAVQPPRAWPRLSPAPHRQRPAGRPGEDMVKIIKEKEVP